MANELFAIERLKHSDVDVALRYLRVANELFAIERLKLGGTPLLRVKEVECGKRAFRD